MLTKHTHIYILHVKDESYLKLKSGTIIYFKALKIVLSSAKDAPAPQWMLQLRNECSDFYIIAEAIIGRI